MAEGGIHNGRETYFENIKDYDGSARLDALLDAGLGHPLVELTAVPLDDAARAEEAHDAWRGAETARHKRDAAILVDVRDCLTAGARGVQIGDLVLVDYGERVRWEALGRYVDVSTRDWGAGDEEQRLCKKPFGQIAGEGGVKLGHCLISSGEIEWCDSK